MAKKIKKISDLVFDKKNINKGSEYGTYLLEKSLKELGAGRSVLADKNGVLIAGNKTVEKFHEIGMDKIKVVETDGNELVVVQRVDLDINSAEGAKMKILDNTVSKHNYIEDVEVAEAVCEEFEIEAVEFGLEDKPLKIEVKEDDYEIPEEIQTDIVLGDLFEIGQHRLLCGDSTDSDAVARLMNGDKADIAFTSPPYNAGKSEFLSGNTHTTDNKYREYNDDKKQSEYLKLLIGFTNNALIHSNYLICNIQSLAGNKIALIEYLYHYKNNFIDVAIWDKGSGAPAMAENVMTSVWEYLFFISSKENPSRAIPNAGFRGTITNIYRGKAQRNNEFSNIHAATFPIDLAEWALQFTKNNDIILDQFLGTGTTMVAAHQLNRKCYGMEIDPVYCQVIIDRMRRLDPTLAIKRNGKPYA
jgi:DNA modification methylase